MLTGSYSPDDVTFLLTDLSGEPLERDLDARERHIQAGRNYAELLPIEHRPTARYLALFDRLLEESAREVAENVGLLAERLLTARGRPVIVSLARAGTPIGILLRRWAGFAHGVDTPHYSISIVRGRGIDTAALDYIVARHSPDDVVFVDGWTGKGAITTELAESLAAYEKSGGPSLSPDLGVVADPGGCAAFYGVRADVLVPSACLNSTVSGLVSRTVLNDAFIKPGMFHGAKVYRELADVDRSNDFLDAVTRHFPAVAASVATRLAAEPGDRALDWRGEAVVRRVREEFALPTWHLVKPGIGETTRVLLRRMPSHVLARPDRRDALRHVELLAAEKGVPVLEYADMPYACIGLIKPAS